MDRLAATEFPVFAKFTYGKRLNKTFKGTEKAPDLLQIHSEKSRLILRAADRFGFVSISQFKAVPDLDSKATNTKSDKSLRSPVTHYDY